MIIVTLKTFTGRKTEPSTGMGSYVICDFDEHRQKAVRESKDTMTLFLRRYEHGPIDNILCFRLMKPQY